MNIKLQQFNILNKTKTIDFKLSNFDRKSVLLLICMQRIYAIIKMVSEKTCSEKIAKMDIVHYNNQAAICYFCRRTNLHIRTLFQKFSKHFILIFCLLKNK
jgi:hypothetical protein